MRTLWHDVRYGFRMLGKNPGFTAVAVLTLALGIGANTAVFSVVNAVLLRRLPFADADRLLLVYENSLQQGVRHVPVAPPNYLDWRTQSQVFEEMAIIGFFDYDLSGIGQPERVEGLRVSASLFSVLRVRPILGRAFTAEEDQYGRQPVVILSYGLWQRRFGGNPGVIGRTLKLSAVDHIVVGVMPNGFRFLSPRVQLWVPIAFNPAFELNNRGQHSYEVVARLRSGVQIEKAQAEMAAIALRLGQQFPDSNRGWGVELQPLQERGLGPIRPTLLILLGAVSLVLLIACANVANLLLARGAARRKEFALRMALGASWPRLIRHFLAESIALGLCGGLAGVLLAYWSLPILVSLAPRNLPRLEEVSIDKSVLTFTLAISGLTGVLFGLAPALHASRLDLNVALREGTRGLTQGVRGHRAGSLLVAAQVGLSLVLLVGAGLLLRSFLHLRDVDPGFRPSHMLKASLLLPEAKYPEMEQWVNFIEQLLPRVEVLPGVKSAAVVLGLPLSGENASVSFSIYGRPPLPPGQFLSARYRQVSPKYFATMGIPLVRGRAFTERDRREAPPVIIVNETMARQFFPNEDPVGKSIVVDDGFAKEPCEIVGLVGDVKDMALETDAGAQMYLPILQRCWARFNLVVRTGGRPQALMAAIEKEVWALDKDLPLHNVLAMEELLSDSVAQRRFSTLVQAIFSAVALALSAVGLYGLMAFSVSQRTQEIGIRMALGANAGDILRAVLAQGLRLTLIGLTVGLVSALVVTRVIRSFLYDVTPTDPLTFICVSLILAGVALLASYVPARRASKIDPMEALRYE